MNVLRKCTRCDNEKPETEFQYKDKISKMCEECRRKNREITKRCRDKKKCQDVVSYDTKDETPTEKTIPTDELMEDGTYTETTTITLYEKNRTGEKLSDKYRFIIVDTKNNGYMYGFKANDPICDHIIRRLNDD